jgi:Tol biopolymer transport system component
MGTEILYRSSRHVDGTDSLNANRTVNVWRVKADGTDLIPLTRATAAGADTLHPEWSVDGSEVVFESSRSIDGTDTVAVPLTSNIWRVKEDGTGLMPLTVGDPNSTSVGNLGFSSLDDFRLTRKMWSPGGTRLIFVSNRGVDGAGTQRNAPFNIWRVNSDGSGLAPVTRMTAIDTDARFLHARP